MQVSICSRWEKRRRVAARELPTTFFKKERLARTVTRRPMLDRLSSTSVDKENRLTCCRVCAAENVKYCGEVEFYFGYAWPIYDCCDCGCRFTSHVGSTYDFLYSERSSCYSRYTIQADGCKLLFDRGDLAGLRAELSQASKYRLIIDEIERLPPQAR